MIAVLPSITIMLTLAILAIAAFWDIKTLEVPDWLNYGGIIAGIGIHAFWTVQQWSIMPIIYSIAGLAAGLAVGCLMYYTGQWGGGDAKLLMAVGALIGAKWSADSFGASFLVNLILMGAAWGLIYLIILAAKNANKTYRIFKTLKAQKQYSTLQLISAGLAATMILLAFLLKEIAVPLIAIAITGYFLLHLILLVRSVELTCMHKWVTPDKLVEGDWLVHPVSYNNKIIAEPSKTGLKISEVKELKKLYNNKKINKVCIKYGIPFTPAFLISFIITLAVGNLILYAINL